MTKCDYCHQEMTPGTACTLKVYGGFPGGVARERIPYDRSEPGNCRDCNTPDGGLHHPGCDTEQCPGCRAQSISCNCADAA